MPGRHDCLRKPKLSLHVFWDHLCPACNALRRWPALLFIGRSKFWQVYSASFRHAGQACLLVMSRSCTDIASARLFQFMPIMRSHLHQLVAAINSGDCGNILAQEVAHLHLELQFCPFMASGDKAEAQTTKSKPPVQKSMMRRMTRSNVTNEHKGVLTVNVISATNLTVSAMSHQAEACLHMTTFPSAAFALKGLDVPCCHIC